MFDASTNQSSFEYSFDNDLASPISDSAFYQALESALTNKDLIGNSLALDSSQSMESFLTSNSSRPSQHTAEPQLQESGSPTLGFDIEEGSLFPHDDFFKNLTISTYQPQQAANDSKALIEKQKAVPSCLLEKNVTLKHYATENYQLYSNPANITLPACQVRTPFPNTNNGPNTLAKYPVAPKILQNSENPNSILDLLINGENLDQWEAFSKCNPEAFLRGVFGPEMDIEELRQLFGVYDCNPSEQKYAIKPDDYFAMAAVLIFSEKCSKFASGYNFFEKTSNGISLCEEVNNEFNTYELIKTPKKDGVKHVYENASRPKLASILQISVETLIDIENLVEEVADYLRIMINGNRIPRHLQRSTAGGMKPKMETWSKKPEHVKLRLYAIIKSILSFHFGFSGKIIELIVRRLAYHIAQNKAKSKTKPLSAGSKIEKTNQQFRKNILRSRSLSPSAKKFQMQIECSETKSTPVVSVAPTSIVKAPTVPSATTESSITIDKVNMNTAIQPNVFARDPSKFDIDAWLNGPQSDLYLMRAEKKGLL